MSREEIDAFVDVVSREPMAGDELQGTGGCRKVRFSGRGKGKSGGYRIITFFTGSDLPVFLLTVFGKGERSSLSKAECNALGKLTKTLADAYRSKIVKMGTGQ